MLQTFPTPPMPLNEHGGDAYFVKVQLYVYIPCLVWDYLLPLYHIQRIQIIILNKVYNERF